MLKWMWNEPKTIDRHRRSPFIFAAMLLAGLIITGCVSPPRVDTVASPVVTGKPVSMDTLFVVVSSSAGNLAAEKQLLSDSIISGLRQTEMFTLVTGDPADIGTSDGIKITADITAIKKVSDNAREWEGALAGRACIWVRVTVTDLKSGQPIEVFAAEGQSGESAFAGTTDEAIQQAVRPVVAEMLKLNAQSGQ